MKKENRKERRSSIEKHEKDKRVRKTIERSKERGREKEREIGREGELAETLVRAVKQVGEKQFQTTQPCNHIQIRDVHTYVFRW